MARTATATFSGRSVRRMVIFESWGNWESILSSSFDPSAVAKPIHPLCGRDGFQSMKGRFHGEPVAKKSIYTEWSVGSSLKCFAAQIFARFAPHRGRTVHNACPFYRRLDSPRRAQNPCSGAFPSSLRKNEDRHDGGGRSVCKHNKPRCPEVSRMCRLENRIGFAGQTIERPLTPIDRDARLCQEFDRSVQGSNHAGQDQLRNDDYRQESDRDFFGSRQRRNEEADRSARHGERREDGPLLSAQPAG